MLNTRLVLYRQRHPAAPPAARRIELDLELSKTTSRVGEPLEVVLRIRSVGSEPAPVNTRFAVNSAHAPDAYRELVFDVHGPDGKLLPFTLKVRIGQPGAEHVKSLAPGERLENRQDLTRYFDLSTPGEYRVSALYESAPVLGGDGRPASTERLYGRELAFERTP
jgi:hypothetical protein